jgi:hypothetical protein
LYIANEKKQRAAALYYFLILILFASFILLITSIARKLVFATQGLIIADVILIASLVMTRLGYITLPSLFVSLGLLAVNTYIIFHGEGLHDISVLGLAIVIALAGLLLGKRGAIVFAGLSILCLCGIFWADKQGLTGAGSFASYSEPSDLLIMGILLGVTAALIYFAMNNFSRSLENIQHSEQALRKANEDLEHNAAILEKRTEQLLTGARVSRVATSILEPDELSQQVVDMVSDRFGLYYVGLFLLDKKKEWAVLHAGTGEPGQEMLKHKHRLKVGNTSMIGWCIANQKARIALDVGG